MYNGSPNLRLSVGVSLAGQFYALRQVRHDIKPAVVSTMPQNPTTIGDLRSEVVVGDHIDSFVKCCNFLQLSDHCVCPLL